MIPRDIIEHTCDTQRNILDAAKAAVDMAQWFTQKSLDEVERYTKLHTAALNSVVPCKPDTKSAD